MIETIQNRDYMLIQKRENISKWLFKKSYELLNEHEKNEVKIQLERVNKNGR